MVVAFSVFGEDWISAWWLLLPLAVFAALVVVHARVVERLERSQRAIQFYERGLARLEDRWTGTGETGDRFRNPSHLYSEDLDLFGKGSLFELLSTARTRAGEDFLAAWLLTPGSHDEVTARHDAVRELGPLLDLREDLAILGATVRSGLDPDATAAWGEAPEVLFPSGARYIAPLFAAALVISPGLYIAGIFTRTPVLAVFFIEMAYAFFLGSKTSRVSDAVGSPSHDLLLLAELLRRLEKGNPPLAAARKTPCALEHRTREENIRRHRPSGPAGGPHRLAAQSGFYNYRVGAAMDSASGDGHRTLASRLGPAYSRMD